MTGIAGVPRNALQEVRPHIEEHLEECVKLSKGETDMDTLWRRLNEGLLQLWLATDGETVDGVTITEIPPPPSPYCTIVFAYGINGMDWVKEMESEIAAWARSLGRSKVRIIGRKGWLRALKGYEQTHTVMERTL
jgi:hypothetical protein